MSQLENRIIDPFYKPDAPAALQAVVVFSGGQDSTTCLGWAVKQFKKVAAIGFRYGQKHQLEIEQAMKIADDLGVDFHIFDLSVLSQLGNSALVENGDVSAEHPKKRGLPASFVPNRNALFLTIAHAFAQKIGASELVTGVCETDYSGYPDCRDEFIKQIEKTLNLGSQADIIIHTPLMRLNKAQTFRLAQKMDVLDIVLDDSHTCYNGVRDIPHQWGYGCGECPACLLRAKGFEQFTIGDYN